MKSKKTKSTIVNLEPKYILLKDACAYCGMERDMFKQMIAKHGLSIYAYGTKKTWFKVSELDRMMESFKIKK